ncbi:hypothetical protein G6F65_020682 [Rhizopus arrhizus]|nr:hypothetical protein G6F65_020682 [Rhizopus arrhizus]
MARPPGTHHQGRAESGLQLGVHGDLGLEHLRDRAAGLGLAGGFLEGLRGGAGDDGFHGQVDGGDGKAVVHFVQRDFSLGVQAGGDQAGFRQDVGQRHGEAAGVRGARPAAQAEHSGDADDAAAVTGRLQMLVGGVTTVERAVQIDVYDRLPAIGRKLGARRSARPRFLWRPGSARRL